MKRTKSMVEAGKHALTKTYPTMDMLVEAIIDAAEREGR